MNTCKYRGIKLSLRGDKNFTNEGRERAKKTANKYIAESGTDVQKIHLIFNKHGFLCPDSKANGKVLVLRATRSGGGQFWISEKQNRENTIGTIILILVVVFMFLGQLWE